MKVQILKECGYDEALLGLSLSYDRPVEEMPQVAEKLCRKDDSESKFLRFIVVWIDITAPRYWWQQFDTYTVGVAKQSESTMHTIMGRLLTQQDFEIGIPQDFLDRLNGLISTKEFYRVKNALPEGFLQRRIVVTNYQTLRRIIRQRYTHKLPKWRQFIAQLMDQLEHQEFIDDLEAARS